MSTCPRCGKSHGLDDRFCGFCGYNLAVSGRSDFETMRDLKVSDIQFDLGVLYYNEGKYEQALEVFEKIRAANPENSQVKEMTELARAQLPDGD